jgi:predicted amidohydrolase YtcJ
MVQEKIIWAIQQSNNVAAAIYETAFKNNWQILTHANGDAAMDQMIRTMKPLAAKYGNDDRRNVLFMVNILETTN